MIQTTPAVYNRMGKPIETKGRYVHFDVKEYYHGYKAYCGARSWKRLLYTDNLDEVDCKSCRYKLMIKGIIL